MPWRLGVGLFLLIMVGMAWSAMASGLESNISAGCPPQSRWEFSVQAWVMVGGGVAALVGIALVCWSAALGEF